MTNIINVKLSKRKHQLIFKLPDEIQVNIENICIFPVEIVFTKNILDIKKHIIMLIVKMKLTPFPRNLPSKVPDKKFKRGNNMIMNNMFL